MKIVMLYKVSGTLRDENGRGIGYSILLREGLRGDAIPAFTISTFPYHLSSKNGCKII